MRMNRQHYVIISDEGGRVETFRFKPWLDQNRHLVPSDIAWNTGSLREYLINQKGWTKQEEPTEVRLFPPEAWNEAESEEHLGPLYSDEEEIPRFALEYQLRDFLVENLSAVKVDGKRLRLFEDQVGRKGCEYPTAVGSIDILAVDDKGNFFVFELKRANSPDKALGQVARYMGWVKETIGKSNDVYGVIVAKTINEKLKFARTVVPNVYLFEYEVSFSLKEAHDLPTASG